MVVQPACRTQEVVGPLEAEPRQTVQPAFNLLVLCSRPLGIIADQPAGDDCRQPPLQVFWIFSLSHRTADQALGDDCRQQPPLQPLTGALLPILKLGQRLVVHPTWQMSDQRLARRPAGRRAGRHHRSGERLVASAGMARHPEPHPGLARASLAPGRVAAAGARLAGPGGEPHDARLTVEQQLAGARRPMTGEIGRRGASPRGGTEPQQQRTKDRHPPERDRFSFAPATRMPAVLGCPSRRRRASSSR